MILINHLLSLSLALVIDRIIGDPPSWPHPVKWMGTLISKLEKRLNKGSYQKGKGSWMLFIVLLVVIFPTWLLSVAANYFHPIAGIFVEGLIIASTIAHKNLKDSALEVYNPLQKEDIKEARFRLSYIVGRDTEELNEQEIVRGTVETVAENTSDGVTAPMFWAFIGGAPLAMLYRAINTCDSMVGYKNDRYIDFGWASARMDDIANWIPSRLTACVMLLANQPFNRNKKSAWKMVLRDARRHPSPNSGWCEAAAAALLGVQLGGTNTYKGIISNRALMGDKFFTLEKIHIIKMNRILSQTVLFFFLLLWIGGVLIDMAITWF